MALVEAVETAIGTGRCTRLIGTIPTGKIVIDDLVNNLHLGLWGMAIEANLQNINNFTSYSLAVTVVVIDIGERDSSGAIQTGELATALVAGHLTRRNTSDISAINSLAGENERER